MKFTAALSALLFAVPALCQQTPNLRGLADVGTWYEVDRTKGQSPDGLKGDGKSFSMTIGPEANAVKIHSTDVSLSHTSPLPIITYDALLY